MIVFFTKLIVTIALSLIEKNVVNSKIMTFLKKKKTIAIDISVTFKTCHNKRIRDIYLTVVNT